MFLILCFNHSDTRDEGEIKKKKIKNGAVGVRYGPMCTMCMVNLTFNLNDILLISVKSVNSQNNNILIYCIHTIVLWLLLVIIITRFFVSICLL